MSFLNRMVQLARPSRSHHWNQVCPCGIFVLWHGIINDSPTPYLNIALPVLISFPLLLHLEIQALCPLLRQRLVSAERWILEYNIAWVVSQCIPSLPRYLRGRFVHPRPYKHIWSTSTSLPQQCLRLVACHWNDFAGYRYSRKGSVTPISIIRLPKVYWWYWAYGGRMGW